MPKIIEGLQDRIIEVTRTLLLEKGLSGVTVRTVASALSIAPGTIYNYFSSKEMLFAQVFLSDWLHALEVTKKEAKEAKSPLETCSLVYRMIQEYTAKFSPIWKESPMPLGERQVLRHRMLKTQIVQVLVASPFFQDERAEGENLFLAEILLTYATGDTEFEKIRPFLERLLK